jgi:hypothetical protein
MKRISEFLPLFLLVALFVAQPNQAKATTVAAVICTGAEFPCLPADVVDSGIRANGVGLLGPNRYAILPFSFSDALMSFNGTVAVADSAGKFIYSWGTGTATAGGLGIGLYLDVGITQNYVTAPGGWGISEMNVGTCNATAAANASTSLLQGAVNGVALPVLGAIGDCAIAPFAYGAGPFAFTLGLNTNLTAAAQFFFAPGLAGVQTITLPWGDDFPDPTINFNDPNDPLNFITPSDLPNNFLDAAPEPATFGLVGGILGMAAMVRRRFGRKG